MLTGTPLLVPGYTQILVNSPAFLSFFVLPWLSPLWVINVIIITPRTADVRQEGVSTRSRSQHAVAMPFKKPLADVKDPMKIENKRQGCINVSRLAHAHFFRLAMSSSAAILLTRRGQLRWASGSAEDLGGSPAHYSGARRRPDGVGSAGRRYEA